MTIGKILGLAAGKGIKRYRVATKSKYHELQSGKYVGSGGTLEWGPLKRTSYINVAAKSKKQAQIRGFKKLGKKRKIALFSPEDSVHIYKMNKFRRPQAFKYTKGQKAKRSIDILKHKHYGKVKRWGTLGRFEDDFVWRSY